MIGIIIQARMGSTRLPGKILMDFEGRTLLEHILTRLTRLKNQADIVIATSNLKQDDIVEKFCSTYKGVYCFRGDEQNVLKRYYDCATTYHFDDVVRLTGDNPFPDIEELDRLIVYHQEEKMDFTENFSMLPIGVGMEIISYKALKDSMKNAILPKHFEHADEYILDNLNHYRHGTLTVPVEKNRPNVRLTVDTKQDYEKACYIIRNAGMEYITTEQAVLFSGEFDRLQNVL